MDDVRRPCVLHVIVGHGLGVYFLNAVRSVLTGAPADPLLVIDNASPDTALHSALAELAAAHRDRMELVLRSENDVQANAKVGSLYAAYELAFERAVRAGVSYVHILQGDMQLLWWDGDVLDRAAELFEAHPRCVNIHTQALSRDRRLSGEFEMSATPGVLRLTAYGLTDTGLYLLSRWQERAMAFAKSEQGHGHDYLAQGYEVLCHPWPTVAPIPWPAVVRGGVERGTQVEPGTPFLLRNLDGVAVRALKCSTAATWLEDVCIPWGWTCLTPMWVTDTESANYWMLRYRYARDHGVLGALPRLELRGVDRSPLGVLRAFRWHQPSLLRLGRGALRALEERASQARWPGASDVGDATTVADASSIQSRSVPRRARAILRYPSERR